MTILRRPHGTECLASPITAMTASVAPWRGENATLSDGSARAGEARRTSPLISAPRTPTAPASRGHAQVRCRPALPTLNKTARPTGMPSHAKTLDAHRPDGGSFFDAATQGDEIDDQRRQQAEAASGRTGPGILRATPTGRPATSRGRGASRSAGSSSPGGTRSGVLRTTAAGGPPWPMRTPMPPEPRHRRRPTGIQADYEQRRRDALEGG